MMFIFAFMLNLMVFMVLANVFYSMGVMDTNNKIRFEAKMRRRCRHD